MSYVDAFYEQSKDVVTVVERVDGERVVKELKPVHNFYYKDPNGKTKSIYARVDCDITEDSNVGFVNNPLWTLSEENYKVVFNLCMSFPYLV